MISLAAAALSVKSDAFLSTSAGHRHARLQSLGRAKIRQQAVLQRCFLRLINDRLGFFQRHDEMAVLFHFAPRGFPPFLPVVADDIGHEHLLNLVRRRPAAVAVQHDLDQIQMMRGHLAQAVEVGGLARENVVLGNRLERFGGERQIHRVTRLARKINREPREHRVHRLDPAKAPTAVHAKTARRQLRQRLNVPAFNLAGGRQFFKFLSHKSIVFVTSRKHNGLINKRERQKSKTNCGASFAATARRRRIYRGFARNTHWPRRALSPADRGLCQELVYGVVRWQATLDWLIARKTGGRAQKPALQILLRLGLYQIFWLDRIPDHAAVNETVELAKRNGFGAQAGFVNAVLRGYLREADATQKLLADLKISQPALGWSHPEWLVARWQKRWGLERAAHLLDWNNTPPKTFARVNRLKTDAGKLLAKWREENVEYDFVRRDRLEENLVFELKSHPPLATLESFRHGWFYVQDPSTLLAACKLGAQPGETILDLCAAPGGKTTLIAQLMNNQGRIVALDNSRERLKLLEENCARLGVTCVETVLSSALHAQPPTAFDRVLVDAPCSNTGVMRRRVDLRWRIQPAEIQRLRDRQLDLLKQAALRIKNRRRFGLQHVQP